MIAVVAVYLLIPGAAQQLTELKKSIPVGDGHSRQQETGEGCSRELQHPIFVFFD